MKVKHICIILISVVVLVSAAVGLLCLHNWWHSPGVHVLGNRAYIDIKESAYLIDEYTGQIIGETSVILIGQAENGDKGTYGGTFDGYIHVEGYQIPYTQIHSPEPYAKIEKPYIDISYSSGYRVMTGGEAVPQKGEYDYDVYINTRQPESVIVHIKGNETGERVYAVCASSEENAVNWLNEYNKERYGEGYPTVG